MTALCSLSTHIVPPAEERGYTTRFSPSSMRVPMKILDLQLLRLIPNYLQSKALNLGCKIERLDINVYKKY